jgi:hypothetical protein
MEMTDRYNAILARLDAWAAAHPDWTARGDAEYELEFLLEGYDLSDDDIFAELVGLG